MRGFFDPKQLGHCPEGELNNGQWMPHSEIAERARTILAAIGPLELPTDHGERPLSAVHTSDYLAFLKSAYHKWRSAERKGDALPYAFPIVRRRSVSLDRVDALLGRHSFDTATPIGAGTWDAAYASAQSALSARALIANGERSAFALCRPPGHHAGADYCGGYCYLNNVAIAAQAALDSGAKRVAILDVDYHHGNGTQDIFWYRGDVFFASVHADPASDYPFYWGHKDEVGEKDGRGKTLNLPLPRGATLDVFRRAQHQALEAFAKFAPDILVVSYGADTWEGDPISHFKLTTKDHAALGRDIASARLPTLVVMEGGYATEALGANVASFLSGF